MEPLCLSGPLNTNEDVEGAASQASSPFSFFREARERKEESSRIEVRGWRIDNRGLSSLRLASH
eukprot:2904400-Pyramimonas_sp.AAC.1